MKHGSLRFGVVLAVCVTVFGCGDGEGDGPPSGASGTISVVVKSTRLTSSGASIKDPKEGIMPRHVNHMGRVTQTVTTTSDFGTDFGMSGASAPRTCQLDLDEGVTKSGLCWSPLSLKAGMSAISLWKAGRNPGRILGGGMELSINQTQALDINTIDLNQASSLTGEDNIEGATVLTPTGSSAFEAIQIYFSHLDVKFQVAGTPAAATARYLTYRYVFFDQPLSAASLSNGTTLSDCLGSEISRLANSGYVLGTQEFRRGDVMICEKSTNADCTDSEFKWLNTSGNTLVSTRPASPFRNTVTDSDTRDCTFSGSAPDMNLGGYNLLSKLGSTVDLTAAIDRGVKTYTYKDSTGATTTGTKMTVTLDLDTQYMIFLDSNSYSGGTIADLKAEILNNSAGQHMKLMHFAPIYVHQQILSRYTSSSYTASDGLLPSTVTIGLE